MHITGEALFQQCELHNTFEMHVSLFLLTFQTSVTSLTAALKRPVITVGILMKETSCHGVTLQTPVNAGTTVLHLYVKV